MEYSVKLSRLPASVSLSDRLQERLRYDASRGELIFRGFMTKCSYDEISGLSDDPEYHRAVERLFVLTSAEVAQPQRKLPTAVLVAVAAVALIVVAIAWGGWRQAAQRTTNPSASATAATAS